MERTNDGRRVGLLGAGNMGGAIARGIIQAGIVPAADVSVCDIDAARTNALAEECGVTVVADVAALAAGADVLLLAVKPQGASDVLAALAPHVNAGWHCVVSIMAGVPSARIAAGLPAGTRIVRVMPNTPALVSMGMTAISAGAEATAADVGWVRALFEAVGAVVEVSESQMDAVTAVSGSGPAYLFHTAECLTAAAVDVGLDPDVAETLVTQTLLGAGALLARSPESAATLRERVTSPGGTTAAALGVLDARDVRTAWIEAVAAATARGAELAQLA